MKVAPSRPNIEDELAPARRQTNAMIAIDNVSHVFRTSGRQDHLALSRIAKTLTSYEQWLDRMGAYRFL